jgi:ATP-dependent Clp protease ATP-binding subunit ClpC
MRGQEKSARESALGFQAEDGVMSHSEIRSSAMNELRRSFRPEFINRVDEIIVFTSLKRSEVKRILDILLSEISLRLLEMNIILEVKQSAKDYFIDKGYDVKYGARPLRRVLQKELEDRLSMEMLKGNCIAGTHMIVGIRKGNVSFTAKKPELVGDPAQVN